MIKNTYPKFTAAVLFLLFIITVSAFFYPSRLGALDPEEPIDRFLYDEWTIKTGLPSDFIIALTQTPDGFIWIGLETGLVRYDGCIFEPISLPSNKYNESPSVQALLPDKTGGLWLGTSNGLMHLKNFHLRIYKEKDGISTKAVRCLAYDRLGNLWIGTGLNYLYRLKDEVFTHFTNADGLAQPDIFDIYEDQSGNFWVANGGGGLFLKQGARFLRHPIKITPSMPSIASRALDKKQREQAAACSAYTVCQDRKGVLWLGTDMGLVGIKDAAAGQEEIAAFFSPANGLLDNNVWSLTEDDHGNLWVGTENGLNRIHQDSHGNSVIEKRIDKTIIYRMLEDREKSLWCGTLGLGLKRLRKGTFFTYQEKSGVPFWRVSLFQDRNNVIWVGSTLGDLYRFNNGIFQRVLHTRNHTRWEIFAIEEGDKDELWLGTVSSGIMRWQNGKIIRYTVEDGLSSDLIRAIHRDSQGRYLIGTQDGGVNYYKNGRFQSFSTGDGLSGNSVYSIHEDKRGNIWLGASNGITVLEKGEFNRQRMKTYLTGLRIPDIYQDEDGVIWAGTRRSGLRRFKSGKWTAFTRDQGLTMDAVLKIMDDQLGNFWLASQDGIFKVAKHDLDAVARGERQRVECTLFGLSDGLEDTRCRFGANGAIRTANGELWFGTRKGISVVNPAKISINKYPPPVVIKQVIFNYAFIPPDQTGGTFRGIEDILFSFTVPTFVSPNKIKIKYKLEGYDREWIDIPAFYQRKAHYKNLPPGAYRFRVIASNSSGVWNETGASFAFTLKPYFYQTMVFKIAASLMLLLALVGLYFGVKRYLYLNKLKKKYRNSTLDPEKAEKYLKKLEYLLEVEKLYRDETVTLNSLAEKLGIAPRYLSQIVNEQFNKNFRNFLNTYRIEEAEKLLRTNGNGKNSRERSVLEIAFDVGFNNKGVFNRVFKKETGMTPTEFKRRAGAS